MKYTKKSAAQTSKNNMEKSPKTLKTSKTKSFTVVLRDDAPADLVDPFLEALQESPFIKSLKCFGETKGSKKEVTPSL